MTGGLAIALVALVVLVGVVGLVWLLLGWVGAWRLNAPPSRRPDANFAFTPWELDVPFERFEATTADGVRLDGWHLPRRGEVRTVVVMHGYRGHKGQLLGISSHLWRAGFHVVLFDFRGRGASQVAPISIGVWETADLAAVLDVVERRVPDAAIGLLGYSMGGVVALRVGVDERVRAIAVDSAFASLEDTLLHVARADARRFLKGRIDGRRFVPALRWWHRRLGKPGFAESSVEPVLPRLAGKPILVVHGTSDATVPVEQAERLAAGDPELHELWLVNGALHCGAYFVDRPAYSTRVTAFFARHLGARLVAAGSAAGEAG